ncbi:hypothetical protein [Blastomonas sp. CCH1-A6]|jgi:predicted ArsR family transcriptional regulator|uniref:hypothetical protein n=1 Tax=Blastomonas sp. CCH1-A6 TaxID=1768762 RepID=UPI000ACC93D3
MTVDHKQMAANWLANGGGRTWQLARSLGTNTPVARSILKRLEAEGVAVRCPKKSACNDAYWTLADKAEGEPDA